MYTLPTLQYSYQSLEPHIDARTMEIHHTKHHQAYIDNLNKALASVALPPPSDVLDLVKSLSSLPESIRTAVRNNAGGHINHTFFWETLSPNPSTLDEESALSKAIQSNFKNSDGSHVQFNFRAQFAQVAMARFGSGWAWLCVNTDKTLSIVSTANQDSPWTENALPSPCIPILGLDLWEHAYYLNYQNRRADYIQSFWNIINWDKVQSRYLEAISS